MAQGVACKRIFEAIYNNKPGAAGKFHFICPTFNHLFGLKIKIVCFLC